MTVKKMLISSKPFAPSDGSLISSAQGMSGTFTVPNGVTKISVLVVEPGGILAGGKSRYLNNISVSPGQQFPYSFSAGGNTVPGAVSFGSILTGASGGTAGATAGAGGAGLTPPAYTGGTAGNGGTGGTGGRGVALTNPAILTAGSNTPGGVGGTYPGYSGGAGANGQFPGGGAGTGGKYKTFSGTQYDGVNGVPGAGCVRIIWPGDVRQFPATRTADETSGELSWTAYPSPLVASDAFFDAIATDRAGTWVAFPNTAGTTAYRSTDNGKSFQPVTLPRTFTTKAVGFGAGVFIAMDAVGDFGAGLKSTDYGATWVSFTGPWPGYAVAFGAGVFSAPFTRTIRGTFSVNGGSPWTNMTGSTSGSGTNYTSAVYDGSKFIYAGLGLLKTSVDGKALVDGVNESRNIGRMRFAGGRTYSFYYNSTVNAMVQDAELSTGADVELGGMPQDIDYGSGRLVLCGAASFLVAKKDADTSFVPCPNLSNNLGELSALIVLKRMYFDGAGVFLVMGTYGTLMRGELR